MHVCPSIWGVMRITRSFVNPFLFAAMPLVSLLKFNIESVAIREILRPLTFSLLATVILMAFVWILLRDWEITGFVSSIVLLFFFSYGHVYSGFLNINIAKVLWAGRLIGNHRNLMIAWVLLLAISIWIVLRLKRHLAVFNDVFTIMGVVLLAVPLFGILRYEFELQKPWPLEITSQPVTNNSDNIEIFDRPDIYYILLDGYGRSDILLELYGYNNAALLEYLDRKGFFVAENSRSNYVQTVISLSSSLNMSYLDDLQDQLGQSQNRAPFSRLIRTNEVQLLLEELGYKTIAFSTGHKATELDNADIFLSPPQNTSSSFERLVIDSSALVLVQAIRVSLGLSPNYPGYKSHIQRINYTFDSLSEISKISGPKFVFAHIITPHPPFVFNEAGELVEQKHPFTIRDASAYIGTTDEYLQGYRGQIAYIDVKLKATIDSILANSKSPPVIIIQADHGPGLKFDWDNPDELGLNERTAILNAYYLPDEIMEDLYDEISPVNTFRLIFNGLFGYEMPLLPDLSYYSSWSEPYQFVQIK